MRLWNFARIAVKDQSPNKKKLKLVKIYRFNRRCNQIAVEKCLTIGLFNQMVQPVSKSFDSVLDTGAAFTFGKCRDQHQFIPEKYYFKMDAIKQVCCGDRHTTILTHASKLYSFGANDYGQLGHGHNRPVSQPKKIKGPVFGFHALRQLYC